MSHSLRLMEGFSMRLAFASIRNICFFSFAALTLVTSVASRAQSNYTLIDLGASIKGWSYGVSINNSGQVAGYYDSANPGDYQAARWIGTTAAPLDTLGGTDGQGVGINSSGQVAGFAYTTSNATYHAVRWTGTTAVDLGTLGGLTSSASGINDSGQVTGSASTRNATHAVRWTGTTAVDLGTLGGMNSVGSRINASGQVVGFSDTKSPDTTHAVRWTGTTAVDLGTLGGKNSYALGINDKGQVAGYSDLANSYYRHAVRWTGTTAADLGTLGGNFSYAYGINAVSDVVGESSLADRSGAAFLYSKGRMIDLNTLLPTDSGYHLDRALGINDNGWITGQCTIGYQIHAYILRPNTVPEPSTAWVLGIGSWVLGAGLKRRRRTSNGVSS